MPWKKALLKLICLSAVLFSFGCEKALFPDDAPRSQYERHQSYRGTQRDAKKQDGYSGNEANVRERLKPLDDE